MPGVRFCFGLRSRLAWVVAASAIVPACLLFTGPLRAAPAGRDGGLLAAVLCAALGALGAGYAIERLVLRRVRTLRETAARLRGGDFAARTNLPGGGAELGALAREFDAMAAALEQRQQDRVRADERLRLSEARKSAVLEASFDGILVLDAGGAVQECNAAARALFGCDGRRCVHHRLAELFPRELPFDPSRFNRPAEIFETTGCRLDRSEFPAEMSIAPIRDPAARGLFVATVRDVTARRQLERSLESLSFRDELTGVYNRRGFLMFATQQLKMAARSGQSVLLLSVDLDGLKGINDQFGHPNGDRALVELARALSASFRQTDVIGRLGGDEFVVLASESEQRGAEQALERFAVRIANRNAEGDLPWTLSASMGWLRAEPGQDRLALGELLARVDERMYAHKRRTAVPAAARRPSLQAAPGAAVPLEPHPQPIADPAPAREAGSRQHVS